MISSSFTKWMKRYAKKKASQPAKDYTSKYFRMTQMKKAYRILYNHRTFQIIKKSMKETALKYRHREVQRSVFDRLLANKFIRQQKNYRNCQAQTFYKRVLLTRWMNSMNEQAFLRDQILSQMQQDPEMKSQLVPQNINSDSIISGQQSVGSTIMPRE